MERVAAFAEAATRLSDPADAIPDELWDQAARHYNETALSALVMSIGRIKLWHRVNATARQVGGEWTVQVQS